MCIIVRFWPAIAVMAWIGQISLEVLTLEFHRLLYLKLFTLCHLYFFTRPHTIYGIQLIVSSR